MVDETLTPALAVRADVVAQVVSELGESVQVANDMCCTRSAGTVSELAAGAVAYVAPPWSKNDTSQSGCVPCFAHSYSACCACSPPCSNACPTPVGASTAQSAKPVDEDWSQNLYFDDGGTYDRAALLPGVVRAKVPDLMAVVVGLAH